MPSIENQLDNHSDIVENTLAKYQISCLISGGTYRQGIVELRCAAIVGLKVSEFSARAAALAVALSVKEVTVFRSGAHIYIRYPYVPIPEKATQEEIFQICAQIGAEPRGHKSNSNIIGVFVPWSAQPIGTVVLI